ncbi:hypothetical protein G6F63_016444 [Rhizopus arrhizus]|nr:hypothetical protein G6F63_016444 [Rhizopus arrhizus]
MRRRSGPGRARPGPAHAPAHHPAHPPPAARGLPGGRRADQHLRAGGGRPPRQPGRRSHADRHGRRGDRPQAGR